MFDAICGLCARRDTRGGRGGGISDYIRQFTVRCNYLNMSCIPDKVLIWHPCPDSKVPGPTWGPSGADRAQVGPMLAPWTLLSGWNENLLEIKLSTPTHSLCSAVLISSIQGNTYKMGFLCPTIFYPPTPSTSAFNSSPLGQNGCHLTNNICKCFLLEASFGLRVSLLPAPVCVSVWLQLTVTFKVRFNLKNQNFITCSFTTRVNTFASIENT